MTDEAAIWPGWGPFRGLGKAVVTPNELRLPPPPPWRRFGGQKADSAGGAPEDAEDYRGGVYQPDRTAVEMVNAAICLRRPLLVTGKPGVGKTTLAYAVARELGLGRVLRWNISSRSSLAEGICDYDALARLNDYNMNIHNSIGEYIALGPLATALLPVTGGRPRALLIDEIDKADIDLPNDLLHVFEEGSVEVRELTREFRRKTGSPPTTVNVTSSDGKSVELDSATIRCNAFPFVMLTSNGEREFPPPFLRRCIRLDLQQPDHGRLARIVDAHFPIDAHNPAAHDLTRARSQLIAGFLAHQQTGDLATDQLLNAIFMAIGPGAVLNTIESYGERQVVGISLLSKLLRHLTESGPETERLKEILAKVLAEPE